MNADERTLLQNFLSDLTAARAGAKDPEAADLITRALAATPDAGYLLVQHAIVADQALHAAQARVAELEEEVRQPAPAPAASSFLPQGSTSPWARSAAPSYPIPQDYEPMPVQGRPGIFSAESGLGSFLRNAGTTAAGVAGGEMLFSGLRGMFGGHEGGGLFGGGGGEREEVVNNYYDSDDSSDRGDWDDNT